MVARSFTRSHFAVTQPAESVAIENFIIHMCAKSMHIGIMCIWLFECYCADYKTLSHINAYCRSFKLLEEIKKLSLGPARCLDAEGPLRKIQPRVLPVFVALGCVVCACFYPKLVAKTSDVVIASASKLLFDPSIDLDAPQKSTVKIKPGVKDQKSASAISISGLDQGNAFCFNNYARKYRNVGSYCSERKYQQCLRDSHYYHSELQFASMLTDISARLCKTERGQRLDALKASLDVINHNLPADICIPILCACSDGGDHDRIVNIPAGEAVILNSSARAPFLLMIEVLENEPVDELRKKTLMLRDRRESERTVAQSIGRASSLSLNYGMDAAKKYSGPSDSRYSIETLTERMRTAAIMLVQLVDQAKKQASSDDYVQSVKNRIIKEIEDIESVRMSCMMEKSEEMGIDIDYHTPLMSRTVLAKEDPSSVVLKEAWSAKCERVRKMSLYGAYANWRLVSVIVKTGCDLRQELLATQLIGQMGKIWAEESVGVYVRVYKIMITSVSSGVIETIPDSLSVHSIKKDAYLNSGGERKKGYRLKDYFAARFGNRFEDARRAFLVSLAGYSLVTYILQVRDRHNGNILIDGAGHLIHIDFGFMLSNSPGYFGIEKAPFKLTQEYAELLGGVNSPMFDDFKQLFFDGFMAIRKHCEALLLIVQMMMRASKIPCLTNGEQVVAALRGRLLLGESDGAVKEFVDRLIVNSYMSTFTQIYDNFQYYSNGIL